MVTVETGTRQFGNWTVTGQSIIRQNDTGQCGNMTDKSGQCGNMAYMCWSLL